MCEYSSKKLEHLRRHKTCVHLQERKFICDECGVQFKRKDILQQHLINHASTSATFTCDICNSTYKSAYSLKEHKECHENRNDVKCAQCEKTFKSTMVLRKHIKNVHNTPGYKCDMCDKVLNTPFNLKRHRQRHLADDNVLLDSTYSAYIINEKDFISGSDGLNGMLIEQNISNILPIQIILEESVFNKEEQQNP